MTSWPASCSAVTVAEPTLPREPVTRIFIAAEVDHSPSARDLRTPPMMASDDQREGEQRDVDRRGGASGSAIASRPPTRPDCRSSTTISATQLGDQQRHRRPVQHGGQPQAREEQEAREHAPDRGGGERPPPDDMVPGATAFVDTLCAVSEARQGARRRRGAVLRHGRDDRQPGPALPGSEGASSSSPTPRSGPPSGPTDSARSCSGCSVGVLVRRFGSRRVAWVSMVAIAVNLVADRSRAVVARARRRAGGRRRARLLRRHRRQRARPAHRADLGRSILNSLHGVWSIGAVVGGAMGAAAAGLDIAVEVHLAVAAALFARSRWSLRGSCCAGPTTPRRPPRRRTCGSPTGSWRSA